MYSVDKMEPKCNNLTMNTKTQPEIEQSEKIAEEYSKFLERDFNQCFQQMRHYDLQITGLMKFTFTSYTALIGIAFGLYQFSKSDHGVDLVPVAIAVLGTGVMVGLAMFVLIVRERVYFVIVARYINEHRRFFLSKRPLGFQNLTGMYTRPDSPQFFNWRASDSFFVYIIGVLNSVLTGSLAAILISVFWGVAIGVFAFVGQIGLAIGYLVTRNKKTADESVFGKEKAN